MVAEDIEWIIPGKDWPLAGTYRGRAGLARLLKTASGSMETSTEPREFVAQGDRVLVVGFARGKVKATDKPFEDDWVFAMTVRDGKLTRVREYVDTQALARAAGDGDGPGALVHRVLSRRASLTRLAPNSARAAERCPDTARSSHVRP